MHQAHAVDISFIGKAEKTDVPDFCLYRTLKSEEHRGKGGIQGGKTDNRTQHKHYMRKTNKIL